MDAVAIIAVWGCVALASAVVAAFVAANKERDYSAWAFWSFLFPLALVVLLFLPRLKVAPRAVFEPRSGSDDE